MSKKNYLLLGIFLILIIFIPGYARLQGLKHANQTLLSEIEEIKSENQELAQQIDRLEKDPFYIERRARNRLGIGKEGEIRYRVIYEEQHEDDENR
jgi:cell division protein FtsB